MLALQNQSLNQITAHLSATPGCTGQSHSKLNVFNNPNSESYGYRSSYGPFFATRTTASEIFSFTSGRVGTICTASPKDDLLGLLSSKNNCIIYNSPSVSLKYLYQNHSYSSTDLLP